MQCYGSGERRKRDAIGAPEQQRVARRHVADQREAERTQRATLGADHVLVRLRRGVRQRVRGGIRQRVQRRRGIRQTRAAEARGSSNARGSFTLHDGDLP